MAKKLLRVDLDTSFSLFGISCHSKDYRFAWTINKSLNFEFKKSKPYQKDKNIEFSCFTYQLDQSNLHIFANKSNEGFLITSKKNIDYWIMFQNNVEKEAVQQIIDKISKTQFVLAVFEENNNQIKEHFVF